MRTFGTLATILALAVPIQAGPWAEEGFYYRHGGILPSTPATELPGLAANGVASSGAVAISTSGVQARPAAGEPATGRFVAPGAAGGTTFTGSGFPPGMGVSSDGSLTGRYPTEGRFQASVTATTPTGVSGTVSFVLEVLPPVASVSLPGQAIIPIAGVPFSATAQVAGNSVMQAWALEASPSWLAIQGSTGRVSGTPPQGTTAFSYTVVGTDAYGRTSRSAQDVLLDQPYVSASLPASLIPGDPLSGSIHSNLPSPSFSLSGAPSWIGLTGGTLSGYAASAGTYAFDAGAVSGEASASSRFNLQVREVSVAADGLPSSVAEGRPATGAFTASLGSGWSWSLDGASPWLRIDPSSGTLLGTPGGSDADVGGARALATRNGVSVASLPFSIRVSGPAVSFSPAAPTELQEGGTASLVASAGTGGLTWSMTGAPAGSTVDPASGAILIAAPDVTTETAYDVVVTGGPHPRPVTRGFGLRVTPASATVASVTARTGKPFSVPLSTSMTATGTWSATAPGLGAVAVTSPGAPATALTGTVPAQPGSYPIQASYVTTGVAPASAGPAQGTLTALQALAFSTQPTAKSFVAGTAMDLPAPTVAGKSPNGTLSWQLMRSGSPYGDMAADCGVAPDPATGAITGVPNKPCSLTLSYRVTDDGGGVPGASDTATSNAFTLDVTPAGLYAFASHSFTTCGTSGLQGPTQASCRSAYSGAAWAQNAAYLSLDANGKQTWTVPTSGNYKFDVQGASGGSITYMNRQGGKGAILSGTFALSAGDRVTLVVAQMGAGGQYAGAGGGGTAVYVGTVPLIVAGGGAGAGADAGPGPSANPNSTSGTSAVANTSDGCPSGSHLGGTNGSGGGGSCDAGGGGFTGNGGNGGNGGGAPKGGFALGPTGSALGGQSINNSNAGGLIVGGFGGGGGAGFGNGGGGGGYSGGAGSSYGGGWRQGGGGGSFVAASATGVSAKLATAAGHGMVTVTKQ